MILKNAEIIDKDFKRKKLDIEIDGDTIVKVDENLNGDSLDLSGMYVLPGFVDTHIHGACGARISDEDINKLYNITRFEATQGVTSIAITTDLLEYEKFLKQIDNVYEAAKETVGAKIAGIHCEGPFLSLKYKGAMNPDNIIVPDIEKFSQILERGHGLIKIMTVAPEIENAIELIEFAVKNGIVVSMGHTNASYEEANRAIEAGASQLTHVFNAMRPFNHREPGVLGAALINPKVKCEMICDYVHLHPETVQIVYSLKGADGINIISDSGNAAGLNISEFEVGGVKRYVKDGVIRLEDGTIAGSAKTVLDGVRNLISSGIPIEDVSRMASLNPAKSLKLDDKIGSIDVGKVADLVVMDREFNVKYTFVNGECVYKN